MRIESIAAAIPSREVSNETILRMISEQNREVPEDLVAEYKRKVLTWLEDSGSRIRFYRDVERGERASDLILDAIHRSLDEANARAEDVDLFVFCGLSKGYIEPSNASLFASVAGLSRAQCWDLSEACMSFTRALELVHSLFQAKRYRNALVVTAELSVLEAADIFKVESLDQLRYAFAALTVGEAATATFLTNSEAPWSFAFRSAPQYANLCRYPVAHHDEYAPESVSGGRITRVGYFAAYHSEMLKAARRPLEELVSEALPDPNEPDIYIPHATSSTKILAMAEVVKVPPQKLYVEVYPRYGNVVSSSVPVGLWLAAKEGRLSRGDRVALIPASAGMSFAIVRFSY